MIADRGLSDAQVSERMGWATSTRVESNGDSEQAREWGVENVPSLGIPFYQFIESRKVTLCLQEGGLL